ncbi:hypothetical protein HYU94_00880 [Candidatus Daviesbacteria bacterium]|nr:hypothetical protein [Candidatus Daviesbacteria bacterium]
MKKAIIVLFVLLLITLLFYLWQRGATWCNPRFNNPTNSSKIICSLIELPFRSGYEGRSCSERDDCRRGSCVWNEEEQGGICKDNPKGCVELINEKGKPTAPVCFD